MRIRGKRTGFGLVKLPHSFRFPFTTLSCTLTVSDCVSTARHGWALCTRCASVSSGTRGRIVTVVDCCWRILLGSGRF